MIVTDLLDHGIRTNPHGACVIQGPYVWSFSVVEDRAARLTTALREAGISPGDRVAYLGMNEPEFLEMQVACQRAEAIFVPINFRLAMPEIEAVILDAQPSLLICGTEFSSQAEHLNLPQTWHLRQSGFGEPYEAIMLAAEPASRRPLLAATVAQLTYTSGTTGKAKGAVVTNGAIQARIAAFKGANPITGHDVLLQTLPLFHLASLVSYAFTASGAACVTVKEFEPAQVLHQLAGHRATHILLVPTILDALCSTLPNLTVDLSELGTIYYGASPITPSQLARARAAFSCGFAQLYGMTEAGIGVMLAPADHDAERRPDLMSASGRDLPFYRLDVVRDDGSFADPGEVGEVTFSAPG